MNHDLGTRQLLDLSNDNNTDNDRVLSVSVGNDNNIMND